MNSSTRSRLERLRAANADAADRMAGDSARFRSLQSEPIKVVAEYLFQTPPELADQLASQLSLNATASLLEPSAGLGRLIAAMRRCGHVGHVTACDISPQCCRELSRLPGVVVRAGDFLQMEPEARFDGVAMNPPFDRGVDIEHVRHAARWVRPGGRLAAIVYGGAKQERALRPAASRWQPIAAGAFRAEGTKVATVLALFDDPGQLAGK